MLVNKKVGLGLGLGLPGLGLGLGLSGLGLVLVSDSLVLITSLIYRAGVNGTPGSPGFDVTKPRTPGLKNETRGGIPSCWLIRK